MRPNPNPGRVYRRCACRDSEGKQLGTNCPRLANPRDGTWAFAVDRPTVGGKRKTMRHQYAKPMPGAELSRWLREYTVPVEVSSAG